MALEIKTEIIIQATPSKLWQILTNFEHYPIWNPFIQSIEGNGKVGEKLVVKIKPPGAKGMTFKPKILTVEKDKELSWIGHLLFPGLFDGLHKFEIRDNGDDTSLFLQSEKFKGLLVPFFRNQLNTQTRKGFLQMNNQLKLLAEKK